jgi:hypothetical protein
VEAEFTKGREEQAAPEAEAQVQAVLETHQTTTGKQEVHPVRVEAEQDTPRMVTEAQVLQV